MMTLKHGVLVCGVLIGFAVGFIPFVAGAEPVPITLEAMETLWLDGPHANEPNANRFARLEETLFGHANGSAPESERQAALAELYARYTLPATTATETPMNEGYDSSLQFQQDNAPPPAEAAMDAPSNQPVSPPLIGALEQVMLHRRFDEQSDADRLNRLEWKAFLTTFERQPLDERINRLVQQHPEALEIARSVTQYQQSLQPQALPVYAPPSIRPGIQSGIRPALRP